MNALLTEADRRKKIAMRLARIEGQVRGIKKLVEDGSECEKVAMQMAATRKALDKAFYQMLSCGLQVQMDEAQQVDDLRDGVDELARLLSKYA